MTSPPPASRSTSPTGPTSTAPAAPSGRSGPGWWHLFWAIAGTVSVGGAQWAVIAVLARTGGATAVGSYALALACSAPLFTLAMMQLRVVWVTERDGRAAFADFVRVRCGATAVAAVLLLGVSRLLPDQAATVAVVIALARSADAIGDLYLARLQRTHRMDLVGIVQTSSSLLGLGGFILLALGVDPLTALWALPAASVVAGWWSPALLARRFAPLEPTLPPVHPETRRYPGARALARLGLPLGLASMIASLTGSVPRLVLAGHRGTATVGVFSALGQLGQGVSTVTGAIASATLPETARRYRQHGAPALLRRVRTGLISCGLLGVVLVLAVLIAGPAAVTALYGEEFATGRSTLLLLVALTTLTCTTWFLDHALTTARLAGDQLRLNAVTLAVTALGCAVAVPPYGVPGALAAATLGSAVSLISKWRALIARAPEAGGPR